MNASNSAVDEWTLSQNLRSDTSSNGGIGQIENHYKTFIVSLLFCRFVRFNPPHAAIRRSKISQRLPVRVSTTSVFLSLGGQSKPGAMNHSLRKPLGRAYICFDLSINLYGINFSIDIS